MFYFVKKGGWPFFLCPCGRLIHRIREKIDTVQGKRTDKNKAWTRTRHRASSLTF